MIKIHAYDEDEEEEDEELSDEEEGFFDDNLLDEAEEEDNEAEEDEEKSPFLLLVCPECNITQPNWKANYCFNCGYQYIKVKKESNQDSTDTATQEVSDMGNYVHKHR